MLSGLLQFLCLALTLECCNASVQSSRTRPSVPSEGTEQLPGYLDRAEKEVAIDEDTEISVNQTTLKIPKGSAESSYRVRIVRRQSPPELTASELAVLGDPLGDVIDVEIFDATTGITLSSDQLNLAYEFQQRFTASGSSQNLGLMLVTDPGTSNEGRMLLPSSELNFTSQATVAVNFKLTVATVWLVRYTDEAASKLTFGTSENAKSLGGQKSKAIDSDVSSNTIDASLVIDDEAGFTSKDIVSLRLKASDAVEMYLTNEAGCSSGGKWQAYEEIAEWRITTTNAVARVHAKFKTADGRESACISDGIIHDDIPPSAPSTISDGTSSSSLTQTPTITWDAVSESGSGVSHYQIGLGTTAGSLDVKPWTDVGSSTSISISGLSLADGEDYFASVRAVDFAGLQGGVVVSDGWIAALPVSGVPTSKGPKSPNAAAVEGSLWSNPSNVTASDDLRVTTGPHPEAIISGYVKVTDFFTSDSIPSGSTILGISVAMELTKNLYICKDASIRLIKNGTIGTTNKAKGVSLTVSYPVDTIINYGGEDDLWGDSWTATDINSSAFGVAISMEMDQRGNCMIDHVSVTVRYTPP